MWCLFEIAAFLHSRPEGQKPHLIIRPTLLGPLLAAASLAFISATGAAYVSAYLADVTSENNGPILPFWLLLGLVTVLVHFRIAELARRYCREVENLSQELRDFRLDDAMAWCCSVGHVHPVSGQSLHCDRAVVQKCICSWFGCVEEFERTVRTEVLNTLNSQLSTALISYLRIVQASPCILWTFADFSVKPMRRGNVDTGIWMLCRGFAYWLGVVPALFAGLYKLAYLLRRARRSRSLDKLLSLMLACFGVCFFVCVALVEGALFRLLRHWLPATAFGAIFCSSTFTLAALVWRCFPNHIAQNGAVDCADSMAG